MSSTQKKLRPCLQQRLRAYQQINSLADPPQACGRLTRMVGLTMEAVGLNVSIGKHCLVHIQGKEPIETEVVGFQNELTYLMPVKKINGLQPGAKVQPCEHMRQMQFGDHLRGRIINGLGQPLDNGGHLQDESGQPFQNGVINPLEREPISVPLDVGIRAINSLLTVGRGQRLGLFAGSGVGKSVLLGMMTKFTNADIVVVGLVGERGREVKEFIEQILGKEGLKRAIVVASPADDAPLMRLRAAQLSTQIAEYFRDQGKNVLLLMDSLTRFAQAQREIALAVGEPPATKGYPPSVFTKIPELVERAGNGKKGSGSVTAFYTVLTEGDDLQDPVADSARAILDGHIVLSRQLAEEGLYPAIDVEASISRVMPQIVPEAQIKQAQKFKQLLARYRMNRDLIAIGAYKPGADKTIDQAIERFPHLTNFISQGMQQSANFAESLQKLNSVLAPLENSQKANP